MEDEEDCAAVLCPPERHRRASVHLLDIRVVVCHIGRLTTHSQEP
jgi:hypothetical protein